MDLITKQTLLEAFNRKALHGGFVHFQGAYEMGAVTAYAAGKLLLDGLRRHEVPNIHFLNAVIRQSPKNDGLPHPQLPEPEIQLSDIEEAKDILLKPHIVLPKEGETIFSYPHHDAFENKEADWHLSFTKDPLVIFSGVQFKRCFQSSVVGFLNRNEEARALIAIDATGGGFDNEIPIGEKLDFIKSQLPEERQKDVYAATTAEIVGTLDTRDVEPPYQFSF